MQSFAAQFVRPMVIEDIDRLLDIRIRRISAFDISKNKETIQGILAAVKVCKARLKDLTNTTIGYLEDLLKKFGKHYPRRTVLDKFEAIDRKAVARQNIKLAYDPDTGFFGSDVKGSEHIMTVSEYDLILAVSASGSFRVMTPQSKVLLGQVIYCALFDPAKGLVCTLVYRDGKKIAFGKKVHIQKFVRNREYRLISDEQGKIDLFLAEDSKATVHVQTTTGARKKASELRFDLKTLELVKITGRGTKLCAKPVGKIWL